jgi:hypothetical protein
MSPEKQRLDEEGRRLKRWKRWGPYLSERQWGTVREDYSGDGDAWGSFPFRHAHARAYRWGEDGLLGISDNHQRLCFALALWNGRDPILKERLFGLTNPEGNHGEDIKEVHFYLDSTPTHSYMKGLYKYPQGEFPYEWLRNRSSELGVEGHEPELWESGCFEGNKYFDVFIEYAKADADDVLIRITAHNRGANSAILHLLPTLWFRNGWSWGRPGHDRPEIQQTRRADVEAAHETLGHYSFSVDGEPELLFTENETDLGAVWHEAAPGCGKKNAFHERVVRKRVDAVNTEQRGTKMCAWYSSAISGGADMVVRCRLYSGAPRMDPFRDFDEVFAARIREADEFYAELQAPGLSAEARSVQRQAFAGLLWSKQYYHYVVQDWMAGDPGQPRPPARRIHGRNAHWTHVFSDDVLSMPDKWEYPWFAAWDLAFHMSPFVLLDPAFAKFQLQRILREWYLHPNGQIPAYEWNFSDVNPPVHALACYRIYKIDQKMSGKPDFAFLESCFHKLLMNFTWWVNRKDSIGENIFEGGFLGLDNIGVFDRSQPLPVGRLLEQSDGTSWMAMYALNMLRIAIELAQCDAVYEDIASKFLEHFLYISSAMNTLGGDGLWDEQDGFYYDRIRMEDGEALPLRVRSLVGLIPLFAVEVAEQALIDGLDGFRRRTNWFLKHRRDLSSNVLWRTPTPDHPFTIIGLVREDRLRRVLSVMLDENEFLSPYGIRSLSLYHRDHPFTLHAGGTQYRVQYEPAESKTRMFGGNSNWRGPVWLPMNFLIIEALQRYGFFYGDSFLVEFPTGSGRKLNLDQVATELSRRVSRIFLPDASGRRPCYGDTELFQRDPYFREHMFFHEYFNGDNGAGLGANHQTGWTALVAKLLQQSGE